jgi:hypothetical protein
MTDYPCPQRRRATATWCPRRQRDGRATWNDLLLPAYSAELARETSIFGQQELHRRLHAAQWRVRRRVRGLLADDGRRQQLQTATRICAAPTAKSATLLAGAAAAPRWLPVLGWLPMAFLLSAAPRWPGLDAAGAWRWPVAGADGDQCAITRRCRMGAVLDATQQMLRAHCRRGTTRRRRANSIAA